MKNLKFYTKEARCIVLHFSDLSEDFKIDGNDEIYEKLEEYRISESNILDFNFDLDNSLIYLYLQKEDMEILFYTMSVKDANAHLPVGSYVKIDDKMTEALNAIDRQKAFTVGDELEVQGVTYDLSENEVYYRLNTYVVRDELIDIMYDEASEENTDV